jgi:hypothetical protein
MNINTVRVGVAGTIGVAAVAIGGVATASIAVAGALHRITKDAGDAAATGISKGFGGVVGKKSEDLLKVVWKSSGGIAHGMQYVVGKIFKESTKELSALRSNIGLESKSEKIESKFKEKFPTATGEFTEGQMKKITQADTLINRILANGKSLENINDNMNQAMNKAMGSKKGEVREKTVYVSAEKLRGEIDLNAWKEIDKNLAEIKNELRKDPANINKDALIISSDAVVEYSKKYGGEPGNSYSKAINSCSEKLNESETGKLFEQDGNKPAIHETYARLQGLEVSLSNRRKMALQIKDEGSFKKLDKMLDEVRNARVELMKEFGVEVKLNPKFGDMP